MKKLFSLSNLLNSLTKSKIQKITVQFFSSISTPPRNVGKTNLLFRKISPLGDPGVSIVPVIDQWARNGNPVDKPMLVEIVATLNEYKRFKHALEVSQWMTDKSDILLESTDVSMKIHLIFKVHGLEQAEKYFSNIPQPLKSVRAHLALLNCYSFAKSVDKAEALMREVNDMGYVTKPVWYTIMMNLYCQLGNFEKLDYQMDEMEKKGIHPDKLTLTARLKGYIAAFDSDGIDRIVKLMSSDSQITLDWGVYAVAATGYLKVGLKDKALVMMEKMELLMETWKRTDIAVSQLFQLYANIDKKDEVYRIWNKYRQNYRVYNNVYRSMMTALLKFNDVAAIESIFEEWETSGLSYDFRIPNILIDAYCRNGDWDKAEDLLNRGILRGGKPNVGTWCNFAGAYIMENRVAEAISSLKKAISQCPPEPKPTRLIHCLEFLEGEKNLDMFIATLKPLPVPSSGVLSKFFWFIKTGELQSHSGTSSGEDVMIGDELIN